MKKEKRILEVMVHTLKNPPSGEGLVKNTLEINHPVMLLDSNTEFPQLETIATGTKINLIKSEQLKFPFIADVLSEGVVPSGNKTTVSINKDGSLDVKFPIQASNPPITGTPKED